MIKKIVSELSKEMLPYTKKYFEELLLTGGSSRFEGMYFAFGNE